MKYRQAQIISGKWERKELLVVALIGVLVLTVGIQTIQLTGLASVQPVVKTTTSTAPVAASGTASAPTVPTNLQNIPSMVGGC